MIGSYDFKNIEKEILDYWKKNNIYENIKKKNKGKKKWSYLDGPPYTSGRIHLGTAWGKALRDSIMRFKRMRGFDVFDRAGFDMHGLPTENKVAAKFNFTTKEEILDYGLAKFQKECERFCVDNLKIMSRDFKRIGVWMDFDNPYMPIKPEFMEGEWFLIKKAYEDGRVYKGAKVMTWCPDCETSLSKHELEYKDVSDKSIFVKFKVKEKANEYLIIWTTTPWTIPFNLAVMVNPELDYVRIKVDDEVWIISKGLMGVFMGGVANRKYKVIEEFKGDKLEGLKYRHVFHNDTDLYDEIDKNYKNAFSVILSKEYVDLSAGTGLVHCAPGCGPEDYEVGLKYGLPAFNETDGKGVFSDKMKKFAGLTAKKDDHLFIDFLKNSDALIATTQVDHDYAHCWRCHNPVIYRATEQWFFKVEDLKEKMIGFNKEIYWVPDAAFNAFESWLKNLKDNGITRQRFWGTPVPIWECDKCGEKTVIGSIAELKEKAGKLPENFHIPWIDEITMPCKCGGTMKRIPDILDVWIDSGCAGWLTYDYPQDETKFKRYYPADLILEGKDQIRGWFNLLMVASTLALDSPSFKAVYMHGFINDYRGVKMSKSLGNVTDPYEIIDSFGADTLRYYTIGAANPGMDMNYNPEEPKIRLRNLLILWNLHKFLKDTINQTKIDPTKIELDNLNLGLEDRYILSRLNSTIKETTEKYDKYYLNEIPDILEGFYLDLSRNYIQLIRDKLNSGSDDEKKAIVKVLSHCMAEFIRIAAPVVPFITEKMFLNLKDVLELEGQSVHESAWPKFDEKYIDSALESDFEISSRIIQSILRAREIVQLGVRWPVSEIIIESRDERVNHAVNSLNVLIGSQVNSKAIRLTDKFEKARLSFKPEFKELGPVCGQDTPKVIAAILEESAEAIQNHFEKEGKFSIKVNGKGYDIKPSNLLKSVEVPKTYQPEEFSGGMIYLNRELDEDLEKEGYAREIMRRVQNARKNIGLKKSDSISLYIGTDDDDLIASMKRWSDAIKEKVGARIFAFGKEEKSAEHESADKIKGKKLKILIDVNKDDNF